MYSVRRLPAVGLSPEPAAPKQPTVLPFGGKVVELPYMGPCAEELVDKLYNIQEVDWEQSPDLDDPAIVFNRKVDKLAYLLGCTPAEAELMILKRL